MTQRFLIGPECSTMSSGIIVFILKWDSSTCKPHLEIMEGIGVVQMFQTLKHKNPSFNFDLKQEQVECLSNLIQGNHVFALLPTGYG